MADGADAIRAHDGQSEPTSAPTILESQNETVDEVNPGS